MISARFGQTNYVAAKKMLGATALPHEAIASNRAGLETPNYRRLALAPAFRSRLREAVATPTVSQIEDRKPCPELDPAPATSMRDGNTMPRQTELAHRQRNFLEHARDRAG